MNNKDFVDSIKESVVSGAIKSVQSNLLSPPGRKPSEKLLEMSQWYNKLNDIDKEMVIRIIKETADTSTFGFLCVLDGVRAIENENKGVLKLYYENDNEQILLNDTSNDYLHDIFNSERWNDV